MNYRRYFLFATLFCLPFAIRKILWIEEGYFSPEYREASLYLFEIFLMGYIVVSILEHKKYIKSIFTSKMFHVEHFLLFLLFSSATFVSVLYNETYFQLILLFKLYAYIIFGLLFYRDLQKIVPRGTISELSDLKICSTWNTLQRILLFSLFIQGLIILFQVFFQKSLGVFYLGESVIHPAIAGVATVIINSKEFLRGYGTLLHPNLTAFFLFSYTLSYILIKIVPRGTLLPNPNTKNCSTWNTFTQSKYQKLFHVEQFRNFQPLKSVPRGTFLLFITVILPAFLLTFSKSLWLAALGLVLLFGYLSCSTWNNLFVLRNFKLFHVEQSRGYKIIRIVPRGTILILTLVFSLVVLTKVNWGTYLQQSILERKNQYLSIPQQTTGEWLTGKGLGSYVSELAEKSPGLFTWQLQPIHNTYILAIFELGAIPLLTILLYAFFLQKRKWQPWPKLSPLRIFILSVALVVLALLSVDHYFWDLEQGQFTLIFLFTVLVSSFHSPFSKEKKGV